MITYTGFIKEIERLAAEARRIRAAPEMHLDKDFRRWRLELEGVLSQIAQVGYLLPGSVKVHARRFGQVNNDRIDETELFQSYQMEMDDTINEIQFIIDSHKKHGDPPKESLNTTPKGGWPERLTLSWLYGHAPIGLWVKVVTIGLAIFLAGVFVGQNEIYRKALDLFRAPPAATNAR